MRNGAPWKASQRQAWRSMCKEWSCANSRSFRHDLRPGHRREVQHVAYVVNSSAKTADSTERLEPMNHVRRHQTQGMPTPVNHAADDVTLQLPSALHRHPLTRTRARRKPRNGTLIGSFCCTRSLDSGAMQRRLRRQGRPQESAQWPPCTMHTQCAPPQDAGCAHSHDEREVVAAETERLDATGAAVAENRQVTRRSIFCAEVVASIFVEQIRK